MNYDELLGQQKYQEIIDSINQQDANKTNEELRLLSYCYFEIEKHQDALAVILKIANFEGKDWELLTYIYWSLKRWEQMQKSANKLLKVQPSGLAYYLLAIAESQGSRSTEIDIATKEMAVYFLSKALEFEDYPVDAVLFMAGLVENEKKISLLQNGVNKFSHNEDLLFELIGELIGQRKFDIALKYISPLLDTEYSNDANLYLFEIAIEKKNYSEATKLLDNLEIAARDKHLIHADFLYRQGEILEWLIYWRENFEVDENDHLLVVQHFQKAYINFRNNNIESGLDDFVRGATQILEKKNQIATEVYISGEKRRRIYAYQMFDVIRDVCETVLLINYESTLSNKIVGLSVYVLYAQMSSAQDIDAISAFLPKGENKSLIELAAELLEYPPELGVDLAWIYSKTDPIKAAKFHISGAIYSEYISKYTLDAIKKGLIDDNGKILTSVSQKIPELISDFRSQIQSCSDNTKTIESLLPVYDYLIRALLLGMDDYETMRELSLKFIESSDEEEGLFDFAYSSYQLEQVSDAEEAYKKLIENESEHASAMNNLAVIYENQGKLDLAKSLYEKALGLQPQEKLYSSNLNRIKNRITKKLSSLSKIESEINKKKEFAVEAGISEDTLETINHLYWETEITAKSIEGSFRLMSKRLNSIILPTKANMKCPNCFVDMFYKSRTDRNAGHGICIGCGHKSGWCRCEFCLQQERVRRQKEQERLRMAQLQEFQQLKEKYSTIEYVEWAIPKLNRKDKQFLSALINAVKNGELHWPDICEQAEVVSEKTYVDKLKKLKLIFFDLNQKLYINSSIAIELLHVENVRRISPSIRFEVFQRDNHTCQYCGRIPPDVKLVIDHLFPVSRGGTDDFNNLVTSCEECNSGKSAKLIEQFTGGSSKEEWAEKVRAKRLAIFEERRGRIEEIKQHWLMALKLRRLSEADQNAIYGFIERYEPDWIKAAVEIAARKKVDYYVNYAGAILKGWAKDGPPENLSDPNGYLSKKPATAKQIAYIATLLEKAGIKLADLSEKADFNQLTMLDARNIITALTEKIEVD